MYWILCATLHVRASPEVPCCCQPCFSCRYDIKCKLIDNAVSLNKNVAFTHWRSRVVNKDTKATFEIEAVEVRQLSQGGCNNVLNEILQLLRRPSVHKFHVLFVSALMRLHREQGHHGCL